MPHPVHEEFDIPLNEFGDVIRVRILRQGKAVLDFLVQYEAFIRGTHYPVMRYDGRHGHPHCDILDWNGETIRKVWASAGTTNGQALTDAIDDITANWEQYRTSFLTRQP